MDVRKQITLASRRQAGDQFYLRPADSIHGGKSWVVVHTNTGMDLAGGYTKSRANELVKYLEEKSQDDDSYTEMVDYVADWKHTKQKAFDER